MRPGIIAALAFLAIAPTAGAVDVTACGQVIETGETAELRQDLACTRRPTWPFFALGVYLKPGATLALNGFIIAGDGSGVGVDCYGSRRCTIQGPGEIRGFESGVSCGGCRLVVRDVAFRENVNGIYIPKSGILDAERVIANGNVEIGIWAHRMRATDVEASRNGLAGLAANMSLRLRRITAVDNGREGVRCLGFVCGRTRVVDSTVMGNDALGDGHDIASTGRVRLRDVTCGRSAKLHFTGWRDGDYDTVEIVGSFGCTDD